MPRHPPASMSQNLSSARVWGDQKWDTLRNKWDTVCNKWDTVGCKGDARIRRMLRVRCVPRVRLRR